MIYRKAIFMKYRTNLYLNLITVVEFKRFFNTLTNSTKFPVFKDVDGSSWPQNGNF